MRFSRTFLVMAVVCGGLALTSGQKKPAVVGAQPTAPSSPQVTSQPQARPQPGRVPSQENKLLARRVFEEFTNQGRYNSVDEVFDRNCKVHFGNRTLGLSQAVAEGKGWKSSAPDMFMNVEEVTENGDKVTVVWSARGTHTGQGLGVKPTRRQVSMRDRTVFLIKNGKIVEAWNSEYRTELFRQLGVSKTQAFMFFTTEKVLATLDPIIPDRFYAFLFE